MNSELLTVLSMRQKEIEYLRLNPPTTPATARARATPGFPPPASLNASHATLITPSSRLPSVLAFSPEVAAPVPVPVQLPVLQSPSFFCQDKMTNAQAMARACYSPLSVGQFTHSSVHYDRAGFVWHWITDVTAHFALQRQTAHCASQYAQRILRQRQWIGENSSLLHNYEDIFSVQKRLQILGLVCVFVAAKIEEVHAPKAAAFAAFAADRGLGCAGDELVALEAQVLEELDWNLHPTTVLSWLLFLLAGEPADQPVETMADFVHSTQLASLRKDVFVAAVSVIDAALLDAQSMDFLPSVLAGSAILLADPGLDLVFVAQFLQLDPSLLWECKNWLIMSGCGTNNGLDCDGTRDDDRWDKVPEEEFLFVQTRVPVPSHLAYGLLRPLERSAYDYVTGTPNQVESTAFGMYSNASYLPATCQSSGMLEFDPCNNGGCNMDVYDNNEAMLSSASNVYHFKYGWQGGDVGYNSMSTVQRRLDFS